MAGPGSYNSRFSLRKKDAFAVSALKTQVLFAWLSGRKVRTFAEIPYSRAKRDRICFLSIGAGDKPIVIMYREKGPNRLKGAGVAAHDPFLAL